MFVLANLLLLMTPLDIILGTLDGIGFNKEGLIREYGINDQLLIPWYILFSNLGDLKSRNNVIVI